MPEEIALEQSVRDDAQDQEKLFSFTEMRIHLQRLTDDWRPEVDETEVRRKIRKVEVDVEQLREDGELDEDETLVPVRIIDSNIQREQPAYVNFAVNSRRLAIFKSISNPGQSTEMLEEEFTRGMRYVNWENPFFKCIDGAQTHGWDAVEVVFDESKPLNVGIEHIGHDNLFFPLSALDIQYCPRIIRKYEMTLQQLDKFVVNNGWAKDQVQLLKDARRNTQKAIETLVIYKVFFKKEGAVYVAWFSLEHNVNDWLFKPVLLDLGIKEKQTQVDPISSQPVETWVNKPVTTYPVFILPYRETEEPKLVDHKGRVYLDEYKQEANTAVLSGFINGITRASNIYASPEKEDGTGASLKELQNLKLTSGRIMNNPMRWFSPDYPDPMVIRAMQWFDVSNSQETNQVSFAAMNREDSRKTATEIGAAQQQQTKLDSVQLALFSTFIRSTFSFAWLIVQSQALQNRVVFLLKRIEKPVLGITGQPVLNPQTGQPATESVFVNDIEVISQTYDVRAAGDVDVVQRQETIMKMKQDWPVVSTTALRDRFLADLMMLEYPDKGEEYAQILSQNSMMAQLQGMVARLGMILQGAIQENPEMLTKLPPEQQADVGNLIKQAAGIGQQMQTQQQMQ